MIPGARKLASPSPLFAGERVSLIHLTSDIMQLPSFGSVPPKLAKRIIEKEYVDMWELHPETWQLEIEGQCHQSKCPRCSLVTDINVWAECFATMAVILASAHSDKAGHLFAYLRTITKVNRTFESAAWASYDMAYCRQAANKGSLEWGLVYTALYSEVFAGRAKVVSRCRYCLADTHGSQECIHALVEGALSGPSYAGDSRPGRQLRHQQGSRTFSVNICWLFNSPRVPGVDSPNANMCTYVNIHTPWLNAVRGVTRETIQGPRNASPCHQHCHEYLWHGPRARDLLGRVAIA